MQDLAWLERYAPVEECVVRHVPITDVLYDIDFNCRGDFLLGSVMGLAESIRQTSQLVPVIVQPFEGDRPLRLIAGFRRFAAIARVLKRKTIKAFICLGLSEVDARVINLAENLQRKDLNILEEARGLGHTFHGTGLSKREMARRLNVDYHWVNNRLNLLTLPERVQELAAAKCIAIDDIRMIFESKASPARQIEIAEKVAKRGRGRRQYLPAECRPSWKPRKTKGQLKAAVKKMLEMGVEDTSPRVVVWAAGEISDRQLWADIRQQVKLEKQIKRLLETCKCKANPQRKRK